MRLTVRIHTERIVQLRAGIHSRREFGSPRAGARGRIVCGGCQVVVDSMPLLELIAGADSRNQP